MTPDPGRNPARPPSDSERLEALNKILNDPGLTRMMTVPGVAALEAERAALVAKLKMKGQP